MQVINELVPSNPEQMAQMAEPGPKGPVFMINLLKFKDKAEYEDGRETDLTGREAYQLYGAGVAGLIPEYGGRFFFMADVTFLSLGQVEELWDEIAIAVYPDRNSLFRMSTSPEWQAISVHRAAGLKGQLNIETVVPDQIKALPWLDMVFKEVSG
ncbi:MAG: DUF1330 domain-containing protein [Henriciella sp.]|nr:DUF1330 domain-containing protein [Hyphomonadaceae bacterium]